MTQTMKARAIDPTAPYYPDSPFGNPHILLNKVVRLPACGCRIEGHGNLPSPAIIVFCATHAAVKPAPQVVAECFTCTPYKPHNFKVPSGRLNMMAPTPMRLSAPEAEHHRSLGHDVREVKP